MMPDDTQDAAPAGTAGNVADDTAAASPDTQHDDGPAAGPRAAPEAGQIAQATPAGLGGLSVVAEARARRIAARQAPPVRYYQPERTRRVQKVRGAVAPAVADSLPFEAAAPPPVAALPDPTEAPLPETPPAPHETSVFAAMVQAEPAAEALPAAPPSAMDGFAATAEVGSAIVSPGAGDAADAAVSLEPIAAPPAPGMPAVFVLPPEVAAPEDAAPGDAAPGDAALGKYGGDAADPDVPEVVADASPGAAVPEAAVAESAAADDTVVAETRADVAVTTDVTTEDAAPDQTPLDVPVAADTTTQVATSDEVAGDMAVTADAASDDAAADVAVAADAAPDAELAPADVVAAEVVAAEAMPSDEAAAAEDGVAEAAVTVGGDALPAAPAEPAAASPSPPAPRAEPPSLGPIFAELGPGMRLRLRQVGYGTPEALAAANAAEVREQLGEISRLLNVEAWIAEAQRQVGGSRSAA